MNQTQDTEADVQQEYYPNSLTFTTAQVAAGRAYLRLARPIDRGDTQGKTWNAQAEAMYKAAKTLDAITNQDRRLRGAIEYYLEVVRGERY